MSIEQTNTIPESFYAGDKLVFEQSFSLYTPDFYSLKYIFINASGKIEVVADKDLVNNKFTVSLSSVDTAAYVAGEYKVYYILEEISTTNTETYELNRIEIKESISSLGNKVITTHNEKVLESIKAVIEDRATYDQMSYSINGRSLSRMPIKDLLYFKDYYQGLVNKEKDEEVRKIGQVVRKKNRIYVRLK